MLITQEQLTARLNSEGNILSSSILSPNILGRGVPAPDSTEENPPIGSAQETQEGLETQNSSSDLEDNFGDKEVTIVKWGGHSKVEREHYKLTHDERVSIGALGQNFPPKDVAELTGVSVDCVRDLRNGKKGSSGYNAELAAQVSSAAGKRREEVSIVAVDKLLESLGVISTEKLQALDAKGASLVASNLSRVVSNMSPKESGDGNKPNIKIVLFQPKPSEEKHFETIEIGVGA